MMGRSNISNALLMGAEGVRDIARTKSRNVEMIYQQMRDENLQRFEERMAKMGMEHDQTMAEASRVFSSEEAEKGRTHQQALQSERIDADVGMHEERMALDRERLSVADERYGDEQYNRRVNALIGAQDDAISDIDKRIEDAEDSMDAEKVAQLREQRTQMLEDYRGMISAAELSDEGWRSYNFYRTSGAEHQKAMAMASGEIDEETMGLIDKIAKASNTKDYGAAYDAAMQQKQQQPAEEETPFDEPETPSTASQTAERVTQGVTELLETGSSQYLDGVFTTLDGSLEQLKALLKKHQVPNKRIEEVLAFYKDRGSTEKTASHGGAYEPALKALRAVGGAAKKIATRQPFGVQDDPFSGAGGGSGP